MYSAPLQTALCTRRAQPRVSSQGFVFPRAIHQVSRPPIICPLLDVISKLVERTTAHLIADHLERKHGLHEGQYGCRKRRSCVDAVAVLMNRTQQAWAKKRVAGALVPPVDEEDDAGSEVSERELRERGERQEEREGEAEALGTVDWRGTGKKSRCSFPPLHSWHRQARSRGRIVLFFCSSLC